MAAIKYAKWLFFSFALLGLVFLTSCSDPNPDAPLLNSTHSGAWVDPGNLGDASFHGAKVRAQGAESCRGCHGADLNGTEKTAGCLECHFTINGSRAPLDTNWPHGREGHTEYPADGGICNQCHDIYRDYGYQPDTCNNCHGEGINHLLGQALLDKNSADFHGNTSLSDCSNCHTLSTYCSRCHFGSSGSKTPPGSGWDHGNNDNHQSYSEYSVVCSRCHNLNRSYGNPPVSCHDCHDD